MTMQRERLADILRAMKKFAETRKSSSPALQSVHFECNGDHVTVSGTDLEIGARADIKYNGDEFDPFGVKLKQLYKVVNKSHCDTVQVDHSETWEGPPIFRFSDGTEFRGDSIESEQFPEFDTSETEREPDLVVNAGVFRKWKRRIRPAVADDQDVYALKSVYVRIDNGELHVVGSDGNRLHRYLYSDGNTPHGGISIGNDPGNSVARMPKQFLKSADYLINSQLHDEEIQVWIGEDNTFLSTENGLMWAYNVEGNYPDYQKAIPSSDGSVSGVIRDFDEWRNALDIVSAIGDRSRPGIYLNLSGDNAVLERKYGEQHITKSVPVQLDSGELKVALNPNYLDDLFSGLSVNDSLRFNAGAHDQGILFTGEDGFTAVIMPLDKENLPSRMQC